MREHNEFELRENLLDKVEKVESHLISAYALHNWLKNDTTLTDKDKAIWSDWMFQVTIYRSQLQNDLLEILADEFDLLRPSLEAGVNDLLEEIEKAEDFIKAMDALGKVIGLVSRAVSLAAGPRIPVVSSIG